MSLLRRVEQGGYGSGKGGDNREAPHHSGRDDLPEALRLPLPDTPMRRVRRFARDLALGTMLEIWDNRVAVEYTMDGINWSPGTDTFEQRGSFSTYIRKLWQGKPPHPSIMVTLGYFVALRQDSYGRDNHFALSAEAYHLIETPSVLHSVYIAYDASGSSTLAMMIWSYLQRIGLDPFLDIQHGALADGWWEVLRKNIEDADTLIALLSPSTLESKRLLRELDHAYRKKRHIIPILHDDLNAEALKSTPLAPLLATNVRLLRSNPRAEELLGVMESLRQSLGLRFRDRFER